MASGARKLVEVCAGVQPGESVLVVTDSEKLAIADAVAVAATESGAGVTVAIMATRSQDGHEPPRPVAAAMHAADVIFTPVAISITHTSAIRDACAAGARAVVMTGFTQKMMEGGGLDADFQALKPICEHVAGYFERGSQVRVLTPAGTDVVLSIAGRTGIAKTCIVGPGEFSPVPDIEATVSPVEGSAQGVIVADASIPYLGIGVLREPVRFTVVDGQITSVAGGAAADVIRAAWAELDDPNVYNVAELGIGLNPACRLSGEMLEDEGCWGTVHFGTGTSITLGGNVKAACHYDLLMHKTTIEVDGEKILENGELLVSDGAAHDDH
ncbi:MAG: leucyl aminopeptidase [Chloroflexi bacterium]|nr:leucyl aminopeptidase [Chloroflexota bacterium]